MSSIAPMATPAELSLSMASPAKPSKADDAARQFESLLIAQMLRSARESGAGGSLDPDSDDSESSTMQEVAEQQFSQMLARNGGLGLARLIAGGLKTGD